MPNLTIKSKICTKCKVNKNLINFNKDKTRKDGLSKWCKECLSVYHKQYFLDNRKSVQRKHKIYYKNNREKILIKQKTEQKRQYGKQYQRTHKEEIRQRKRLYYLAHKKQIRKKVRKYIKRKLKNDINFKLKKILRDRFKAALKKNFKSGSAVRDLGCTVDEFRKYIENRFYANPETGEQMTWENYGFYGWHIDHVVPLANFNLQIREQCLKAIHYTNLQPLWAKENLKKSAKSVIILEDAEMEN